MDFELYQKEINKRLGNIVSDNFASFNPNLTNFIEYGTSLNINNNDFFLKQNSSYLEGQTTKIIIEGIYNAIIDYFLKVNNKISYLNIKDLNYNKSSELILEDIFLKNYNNILLPTKYKNILLNSEMFKSLNINYNNILNKIENFTKYYNTNILSSTALNGISLSNNMFFYDNIEYFIKNIEVYMIHGLMSYNIKIIFNMAIDIKNPEITYIIDDEYEDAPGYQKFIRNKKIDSIL